MGRHVLVGLCCVLTTSGSLWAQVTIPVGSAPRLNVTGQGATVPTIGAAPRLGQFSPTAPTIFVPVDVASQSIIPVTAVQRNVFRPRQPSFLDRLSRLLPFATKTGASFVAPEAVFLHNSLPNVTIK
ncbi:MAG: hypothetical protein RMI91_12520 [Gemmatales bacterium]|nr:hypothetical protein [Gemmatales bacterium]MDW7995466.1 hypothetical protein [Gemmatales bacterium]